MLFQFSYRRLKFIVGIGALAALALCSPPPTEASLVEPGGTPFGTSGGTCREEYMGPGLYYVYCGDYCYIYQNNKYSGRC